MHSAVHLSRLGLRGCTSIEPVYYVGGRDSSESRLVEAEELHLKYFENQLKVLWFDGLLRNVNNSRNRNGVVRLDIYVLFLQRR